MFPYWEQVKRGYLSKPTWGGMANTLAKWQESRPGTKGAYPSDMAKYNLEICDQTDIIGSRKYSGGS